MHRRDREIHISSFSIVFLVIKIWNKTLGDFRFMIKRHDNCHRILPTIYLGFVI